MSLNETPSAERLQISFFGCRNAGKSSIVNAVTNQEMSVVSAIKGTTTDPVKKAMELLPLGPVVIIDTAGYDDDGVLGQLRIAKTQQILNRTDIAVLVVDGCRGMQSADRELLWMFVQKQIPYLIVCSKADLHDAAAAESQDWLRVSAVTGMNIDVLKERIAALVPNAAEKQPLIADLLEAGDSVVLVCPIDESAPKGRLILPQQQTIRDVLDADASAIVTKETGLQSVLENLRTPPRMVVTDSQALGAVKSVVPDEIPLTTFSILMARYKGFLKTAVAGIAAAKKLRAGDVVLMAEGCTHHRQCNDIGTVKIPHLLQKYCGCELVFENCSGSGFPSDLSRFSLVIHCGGCMLPDREIQHRMQTAAQQGIPMTNYGIALAQMTGTLERTLRSFPDIHALLCK